MILGKRGSPSRKHDHVFKDMLGAYVLLFRTLSFFYHLLQQFHAIEGESACITYECVPHALSYWLEVGFVVTRAALRVLKRLAHVVHITRQSPEYMRRNVRNIIL